MRALDFFPLSPNQDIKNILLSLFSLFILSRLWNLEIVMVLGVNFIPWSVDHVAVWRGKGNERKWKL